MHNYIEASEFLLSIISNIPYGVIAIDMNAYITMINDTALENLNINKNPKAVIETYIMEYFERDNEITTLLNECLEGGRKEFKISELSYNDKYLNVYAKPILNGMLISFNDVTDNKKAKDEATNALLKGQEIERIRLAKDIHDGVGPLLSTIKLNLDSVKKDIIAEASPKTQKKIDQMEELIASVSSDIRSISHDLMPSALVDFGLVKALENYCGKINNNTDLNVNFHYQGLKNRLDQNIELNLYRIIQELMNNSIKYAKAENISVHMIVTKDKTLLLTVEDDGLGFDTKKLKRFSKEGIGLKNVQTRVEAMKGGVNLDTQIGKGVNWNIEIPIQ